MKLSLLRKVFLMGIIFSMSLCNCYIVNADRDNANDPKSGSYNKPPKGSFIIGNGIATNNTAESLTINVPGSTQMRFGNTMIERSLATWESYAETVSWTIDGVAEGLKTVYAEFRNSAGDVYQTTATIVYDLTRPSGSFVVNNDDTFTTSLTVLLSNSVTDNVAMGTMCFSNDNLTWSSWEAFASTKSWTLEGGEGTKTVYAKFRDKAGNGTVSTFTDIIIYDDILAPEIAILLESTNIPDGTGNVDFGLTSPANPDALEKVFTLNNLGSAVLTITSVTVSGDSSFTITHQPDASVVSGGSTTFTVCFQPDSTGTKNATIIIRSNDSDEDPYTFTISGTSETGFGVYEWTRRIGGSSEDMGLSITTDPNGNLYMIGSFNGSFNFQSDWSGYNTKTSAGAKDIFITKINADGSYSWTRRMGSTGEDVGYSIIADSNGNIYATGYFNGTVNFQSDWSGTDSKISAGGYDVFVTKINADGTYGWTRRMGGTSDDKAYSISTDPSGYVYVTGCFNGAVNFQADWSGTDNKTSAGGSDIFITKINANGTYGWTRRMGGGADYDTGYSIATDQSSNVYVTGSYRGTVDFRAEWGGGTDSKSAAGFDDIFITKINANGTYGWTRCMGGATDSDYGYCITTDLSDNVYVTGVFGGTINFQADWGGTDNKTSAGLNDAYVMKINANGTYGWTHRIGGSVQDGALSIATAQDGNVYVTGSYYTTVNFSADWSSADNKTSTSTNGFVTKINGDGSYGWTRCMDGNSNYPRSIITNLNGFLYVVGYFQNTVDFRADWDGGTDTKTSAGNLDIFLMKIY
jgi:hypothetical protein